MPKYEAEIVDSVCADESGATVELFLVDVRECVVEDTYGVCCMVGILAPTHPHVDVFLFWCVFSVRVVTQHNATRPQ